MAAPIGQGGGPTPIGLALEDVLAAQVALEGALQRFGAVIEPYIAPEERRALIAEIQSFDRAAGAVALVLIRLAGRIKDDRGRAA